jgi:hypothetical protein
LYKKRTPQNRPNMRLRNWVLAMRRNCHQEDKAKALQVFTITRARIHEVRQLFFRSNLQQINPNAVLMNCWRRTKCSLHMEPVLSTILFDECIEGCNIAPPLFTCDSFQANSIRKKSTVRSPVFNAVQMHSKTSTYKTVIPKKQKQGDFKEDGPRMQLADNEANNLAMKKYQYQMDVLLRHIFRDNETQKKIPQNWMTHMQNIVGGTEHQHAHADQGRPQEFRGQRTYPFVATHGFGVFPFQLWLLPDGNADIKYGFLHTFKPTSLLLMRGDCVHAGGVSKAPRCHTKFFPLPKAGIVHDHYHHYWLEVPSAEEEGRKIDTSFLWHGPHFPFAYPYASYHPNSRGRLRT